MRFGIAIFPQKEVQDIANSFRKRYDPHYSLIAPHITLKESFELKEERIESAVKQLEEVANTTRVFSIHFHKISTFYPTSNVIYFSIRNTEELNTLHKKLHKGLLKQEQKFSFVPHLTIGQDLSNDELHDIYSRLRMHKIDLNSIVDRFHLLYQLENKTWTIYQSFLFGKK